MTGDDSSATDTMQLKCRAMRGPSKFNSQSGCRCALASKSRCPLQREVAWTWMSRTENWVRGLICSEADFLPAFLWVCVCFFFFHITAQGVQLKWPWTDRVWLIFHQLAFTTACCVTMCVRLFVSMCACVRVCVCISVWCVCLCVPACVCVCARNYACKITLTSQSC